MIDYQEWASEYFNEAEKFTRNIYRLEAKLADDKIVNRQTIIKQIETLKFLYNECILKARYLEHRAEKIRQRSVN